MATTLERASFGNGLGAKINLKFDVPTGIVPGTALTITTPPLNGSKVVTCNVVRLLPYGSAVAEVTSVPTSGLLVIPKGSAVA